MEHNFERLDVWKRGCDLAVKTYEALRGSREYAFRDQMVRSSLSVPSNIAEGSERGTQADFARFLRISKGASGELRTQAYIADRLGIIKPTTARTIIEETREISSMLEGLIRSLR